MRARLWVGKMLCSYVLHHCLAFCVTMLQKWFVISRQILNCFIRCFLPSLFGDIACYTRLVDLRKWYVHYTPNPYFLWVSEIKFVFSSWMPFSFLLEGCLSRSVHTVKLFLRWISQLPFRNLMSRCYTSFPLPLSLREGKQTPGSL